MTASAPAGTPSGGRVFVSYASADRRFVEVLVEALEQPGIAVDYDVSLLEPGDDWPTHLTQAVRDAAVVVVVWSRTSVSSASVIAEVEVALARGTLVPVTLDGYGVLPKKFSHLYTLDLSGWSGSPDDPRVIRLVDTVQARLTPSPSFEPSRFSPSTREVRERLLSMGPVTALRVVEELRLLRPDYGSGMFSKLTLPVEEGERRRVDDWLIPVIQAVELRGDDEGWSEAQRVATQTAGGLGPQLSKQMTEFARRIRGGEIPGKMVVLALADLDRTVKEAIPPAVLSAIADELGAPSEPSEPSEPSVSTNESTSSEHPPAEPAMEPILIGTVDTDLVVWDRRRPLVDRLQVDTYVTMLATVMTTRDTPLPLSIGLFGEWGSGKSYFMGLLQQQIESFAEDSRGRPDSPFCAAVVQVRFNAWHYADANLWASMAVQLFEQLAGDEQRAQADRERTRTTLLTRLRTYEEARAALAEDERWAKSALATAEAALAETTRRQQESQSQLDQVKAVDVATAVPKDPRLQPLIERVRQEASRVGVNLGPDPAVADLHRLAGDLGELATDVPRLWRVIRERSRLARLMLLVAAVLAVAGGVLLILPGLIRYGAPALVTAVAALAAIARPIGRLAAGTRAALRHVEQTIAVADSVWQQAEQRRQAELNGLRDEVERARAEGRILADRVAQAQQHVEQAQREIDDLGAGRRLYRFIAERAASEDYRKQLGVVSLIRQDFEELTRRLRARRDEGDDAELPTVERIVLYIDDLDRCPPERVVQVLEAVHLLLAMDLFVVVVGVDPRWLLRSLRHQFHQVLADGLTGGDGYWRSTPRDYLEKIFQIPFVLPAMTAHGFDALLRSLVRPPSKRGVETSNVHDSTVLAERSGIVSGAEPDDAAIVAEAGSAAEQVATGNTPERLDLTGSELTFFTGIAPLVRTPRTTKRMVNIYRMLRVTRDLGPASRFLGTPEHGGEYQAVVQLLAVLTGFPALFQRMCWGDDDSDTWPLLRRDPDEHWSAFVEDLAKQTASLPDGDRDDWNRLVTALRAVQPTVTLPDQLKPYQHWAPRISRFSFALSSASPRDLAT
jgi:TIR domain/KAP family P-loop domain